MLEVVGRGVLHVVEEKSAIRCMFARVSTSESETRAHGVVCESNESSDERSMFCVKLCREIS